LEIFASDQHISLLCLFVSYVDFFVNIAPGTVFKTLHFLATIHKAEKLASDKRTSLLVPSIMYEENKVL
jgi:hypothetical protein